MPPGPLLCVILGEQHEILPIPVADDPVVTVTVVPVFRSALDAGIADGRSWCPSHVKLRIAGDAGIIAAAVSIIVAIDDGDIVRIEEPRPGFAMRCAGIDGAERLQILFA